MMNRYPVMNLRPRPQLGGLLEDYQNQIDKLKTDLQKASPPNPGAYGYPPPLPNTPSVPMPAGLSDAEIGGVCGMVKKFDAGTPAEKLTAQRQIQAMHDKLSSYDQDKLDQYIQKMCPSAYQNLTTPTPPPPPPPTPPGEVSVYRPPVRTPPGYNQRPPLPPPPVATPGSPISVWAPPPQPPPPTPMQTQYPGMVTGYPTKPAPYRDYPPVATEQPAGVKCKPDETWTPAGCRKNTPTIDTSRRPATTTSYVPPSENTGAQVATGGGCPRGQFWDGVKCRGSVSSLPSIPTGGGYAPTQTSFGPGAASGPYGLLSGARIGFLGQVPLRR